MISDGLIKNLYADYRTDGKYDPDYVVNFFKINKDKLESIKVIDLHDDLKLFIELIWQYSNGLYQKSRYNDCIDAVDKYQPIIDKEIERLNSNDPRDDWYHGLYLLKGMASYKLRDYGTAVVLFRLLTKHDDRNDNYKLWLGHSIYGQRIWLTHTINACFGMYLFINIFFEDLISNRPLRTGLSIIAILGMLFNWSYEYYIKRSYRKSNNNP